MSQQTDHVETGSNRMNETTTDFNRTACFRTFEQVEKSASKESTKSRDKKQKVSGQNNNTDSQARQKD